MKTTLTFTTMKIRKSKLGTSDMPDLLGHKIQLQNNVRFHLGEYDEIYEGYGRLSSGFPYRMQNIYTRDTEEVDEKTAILENDYIKATFLPDLGGRLWSIIDKETGRNLLYTNDIIRFSNLAIRNAWFSGGVEWNIGMIGHTPFTASPLYVAKLEDEDGNPILRMYETERVRGVTYQMDFMLRENDRTLLCRMRIMNESDEVTPMYWWSNIAIPEEKGGQVVVPADYAYSYQQDSKQKGSIQKVHIPEVNGIDVVHYGNIPKQVDYFFEEEEAPRKFLCGIDAEGYGLMHVSTNRLRSRKMFSWGSNKGSDNWQHFLTDKAGNYIEVQAGLGKTQYGCIPMAPHTSWEWMESYGPVRLTPDLSWDEIRKEASKKVDDLFSELDLERLLVETRDIAHRRGTLVQTGSKETGFHNWMRPHEERPLKNHLEFPMESGLYQQWKNLLSNGEVPYQSVDIAPDIYCSEDEIYKALLKVENHNWYSLYQLSLCAFFRSEYVDSELYARESIAMEDSIWARHSLAASLMMQQRNEEAADIIMDGIRIGGNRNLSFMKEASRILIDTGRYDDYISVYDTLLDEEMKKDSRVHYLYMIALYNIGEYRKAKDMLDENDGFIPVDIR